MGENQTVIPLVWGITKTNKDFLLLVQKHLQTKDLQKPLEERKKWNQDEVLEELLDRLEEHQIQDLIPKGVKAP